jgi:hypothetical protein
MALAQISFPAAYSRIGIQNRDSTVTAKGMDRSSRNTGTSKSRENWVREHRCSVTSKEHLFAGAHWNARSWRTSLTVCSLILTGVVRHSLRKSAPSQTVTMLTLIRRIFCKSGGMGRYDSFRGRLQGANATAGRRLCRHAPIRGL